MKKHLLNVLVFLQAALIKGTSLLLLLVLPFIVWAQPANNSSCSAATLTSAVACVNTAGTLRNAGGSATAFAGVNAFCGNASSPDVWYTFQAQSVNPTITLSNMGLQMRTSPRLALYNFNGGTCNDLTVINNGAVTCVSGTATTTLSLNATSLTIGDIYHIRVFTNGTSVAAGAAVDWNFDICITDPWVNNGTCGTATLLTSTTSCSSISGTLVGANGTTGVPGSCGGGATSPDVWYTFVAQSFFPIITLSNIGANFATAGTRIQLLTSAACPGGSLTPAACVTTSSLDVASVVGGAGLTIGTTYRIRITTPSTGVPAGTWGFSICVQDPTPAPLDYGKSYVNISKRNGGTVNPGDTLEIRATFVINSLNDGAIHRAVDSLAFYDTLERNAGFLFVPGSISLRTNEGYIFGSAYSDNFDAADAGYRVQIASLDTAIRINMGAGATFAARGKLRSYSTPNFYDKACIIMATYRVRVNAAYGTKINFGGGRFSYRDSATTLLNNVIFPTDSLVVYGNPGLCQDAVSVSNAVGVVDNGTFDEGLTQNAPASIYVPGYIYEDFDAGGGPNDYSYGIANNTSAIFTTSTNFLKPDLTNHRVHTLWDIIGDHTGAANQAKGNPPCNTALPISPSNPCGYMLVINSSYKTDVAFNYSVSNLCPNTYYEVSAWIRNMCSKCGCDPDGDGATNGGSSYNPNPSAMTDSSGVKPNLAYKINGIDYYTTGNISYVGTSTAGKDSNNVWVKRGFTYLTGPSETSFNLTLRNNAPGGGGNDWALDDISVVTCLPRMVYSPSTNPTICARNSLTIRDTVTSFFNNYTYYKWQRSTNNGASWTDVTGPLGPVPSGAGPNLHNNGSSWEYTVSYTVPSANTNLADSGNKYRVITATALANLGNSNCEITDGSSEVTLNIMDCGVVLKTDLLSFNGKLVNNNAHLSWTTSTENEPLHFDIERSSNGIDFTRIGTTESYQAYNSENNYYSFIDRSELTGKAFYRIAIINGSGDHKRNSRIIQLNGDQPGFDVGNVINPFHNELSFEVTMTDNEIVDVTLVDLFGKQVRKKSYVAYAGVNSMSIKNTETLSAGIYILQVKTKESNMIRKVIKR